MRIWRDSSSRSSARHWWASRSPDPRPERGRRGTRSVAGMASGLPPAPRWAWIAMIAGVVAIAVLLPVALGRGHVEVSESATDRTTPPAESSASPTAEPDEADDEPPVIAVYGD